MSSALHKASLAAENHVIASLEYADAAARTAAVGLTPADIGRVARQLDDNSFWLLNDDSPLTWSTAGGVSLTSSAPVNVDRTAAVVGTSSSAARADHKHDVSTAAPVTVDKSANAAGSSASLAKADHKHDVSTAAPVTIGTANVEGAATSLARSNHVHAHGDQAGGSLHALATTGVAGFLSAADKVKIDSFSGGNVTLPIRNETGSTLLKSRLVVAVGYSVPNSRITVGYADKDVPSLRPSIAILTVDLPNNSNADGLIFGTLSGVDTTMFALTDQLVLGDNGQLSRPPPDIDPFTGEIQPVGSVTRVHATLGEIVVDCAQGLSVLTASEDFWINAAATTGRETGGVMSRTGGLGISVTSGRGFINSGPDVQRILWSTTPLTLPVSAEGWVFIDTSAVVQFSLFQPAETDNIVLGSFVTSTIAVVLLAEHPIGVAHTAANFDQYASNVIGPIHVSGAAVTKSGSPSLGLNVDSGSYYVDAHFVQFIGAAGVSWVYWYRNGSGDWLYIPGQVAINTANYDNGTGTLASLPAGKWKKDLVFVSVSATDVQYHVVYAQQYYNSQAEAEAGNIPTAADFLVEFSLRLAGVVVLKAAVDIASIVDERPRIGQRASGSTAVTDHGLLTGLSDDDHCFSADTELLTNEGWVTYDKIERNKTIVATFNLATEELEYSLVNSVHVYDSFSELIRLRSRGTEILVTPEHRMVYRTTNPKRKPGWKWQIGTASKISEMSAAVTIPVASKGHDDTYPRPDWYLKLLAWVVSEGSFYDPETCGYGVKISQSVGPLADRIGTLLHDAKVPFTENIRDNTGRQFGDTKYVTTKPSVEFYLPSRWCRSSLRDDLTPDKTPRRHLLQLSKQQFRVFLGELVLGDGSVRGNGASAINKHTRVDEWAETGVLDFTFCYAAKNKNLIDWLQELCAHNGMRTKATKREDGVYLLHCSRHRTQSNWTSDVIPYSGNVWCVSVMKNQTLFLRRDGRVFIAGNTQYQLRSEENNPSGYAGLDGAGKISASAHGSQGGGSLHAVVTTSVAGFASAADKVKIDASIDATAHRSLLQLIHFIDDGPAKGFVTGAVKEIVGGLFPTEVRWKRADTTLLLKKTITRSGGGATVTAPTPIVYELYAADGTTVLETVSDVVAYSGVVETGRVRSIS